MAPGSLVAVKGLLFNTGGSPSLSTVIVRGVPEECMSQTSLLLIDDDKAYCESLSRLLAMEGFTVDVAHTAEASTPPPWVSNMNWFCWT